MKKKIYALMLVVAMLAMTIVGCGSDKTNTTNTTNETEVNAEVEESTEDVVVEEPTETPVVEDPVVEPTEEPTTEDGESDVEVFSDSYTWVFPEEMDGFTDKFVYTEDEDWSLNFTHYVDANGSEMNFVWDGPTELGEKAQVKETTLYLYGDGTNYQLSAWYGGNVGQEQFDKDLTFDKDTWTSFTPYTPYITDGYYDIQTTDTTIDVIYAVSNDTQKGYAYFLDDLNVGVCYQFVYLENMEIYDDTRAMHVVNSLAYWSDYVSEETTIE